MQSSQNEFVWRNLFRFFRLAGFNLELVLMITVPDTFRQVKKDEPDKPVPVELLDMFQFMKKPATIRQQFPDGAVVEVNRGTEDDSNIAGAQLPCGNTRDP